MKIAVVTGASSGMGRDFARQLACIGGFDELWAIARREERLLELKEELPVPVRPVVLDLTERESIERYAAMLEEEKPDPKHKIMC